MNDFKKNNNRFGDKRGGGFGKRDFNRPSFDTNRPFKGGAPKSFGGGRELELFQATCASCNKSCEVPFRPNGKKPVYCKECFAANGGPAASPERSFAPRRDFDRAPSFRSEHKSEYKSEYKPEGDRGVSELKKQMEVMNVKLDKLIELMGNKASASKPLAAPIATPVITSAPVKTPEKKAAVKKPAPKKKK